MWLSFSAFRGVCLAISVLVFAPRTQTRPVTTPSTSQPTANGQGLMDILTTPSVCPGGEMELNCLRSTLFKTLEKMSNLSLALLEERNTGYGYIISPEVRMMLNSTDNCLVSACHQLNMYTQILNKLLLLYSNHDQTMNNAVKALVSSIKNFQISVECKTGTSRISSSGSDRSSNNNSSVTTTTTTSSNSGERSRNATANGVYCISIVSGDSLYPEVMNRNRDELIQCGVQVVELLQERLKTFPPRTCGRKRRQSKGKRKDGENKKDGKNKKNKKNKKDKENKKGRKNKKDRKNKNDNKERGTDKKSEERERGQKNKKNKPDDTQQKKDAGTGEDREKNEEMKSVGTKPSNADNEKQNNDKGNVNNDKDISAEKNNDKKSGRRGSKFKKLQDNQGKNDADDDDVNNRAQTSGVQSAETVDKNSQTNINNGNGRQERKGKNGKERRNKKENTV